MLAVRAIGVAACLLAFGCHKDPTPDLERLATRACACGIARAPSFGEVGWTSGRAQQVMTEHRACADAVLADFTALVRDNAAANADEDSDVSAFLAARKMSNCLLGAGADPRQLCGVVRAAGGGVCGNR